MGERGSRRGEAGNEMDEGLEEQRDAERRETWERRRRRKEGKNKCTFSKMR